MYLGIDIGGTSIKIGFVQKDGTVLKKRTVSTEYQKGATTLLEDAINVTKAFIDDNKFLYEKVKYVGVSATGQISRDTGVVIGTAGHIRGWENANIKKAFEDLLSKEVRVINDANSMIVAEKYFGAAKGYSNVIGLTIGTGIGGGIIVDDKLLLGSNGIAGEIGQIIDADINIDSHYDRSHTYENFASTKALVESIAKLGHINANGKNIIDELILDENVHCAYNKWICKVAKGIVSLVHIFNPEVVIIGGGISVRKEFFEPLENIVRNNLIHTFNEGLVIKTADLGNDAGFIGAVCSFIEDDYE